MMGAARLLNRTLVLPDLVEGKRYQFLRKQKFPT
jgi:hypothetical protein